MNTAQFQPENLISGDSNEDTTLLKEMASDARLYISSFHWAPPIKDIFLAYGVGGVIAVFLVRFSKPIRGKDEALWVITGDLPSAYLVLDIPGPTEAIEAYCRLMEDWANAILKGKGVDEVFPVRAEGSQKNASLLMKRVDFLRRRIIPQLKSRPSEKGHP